MRVSRDTASILGTDEFVALKQLKSLSNLQRALHEFRAAGVQVIVRRVGRERYEILVTQHDLAVASGVYPVAVGRSTVRQKFEFDVGWVPDSSEQSNGFSRPSLKRIVLTVAGVSSLVLGTWLGGSLSGNIRPNQSNSAAALPKVTIVPKASMASCNEPFDSGQTWDPRAGNVTDVSSDLDFGGKRYLEVKVDCRGVPQNFKVQLRSEQNRWLIENAVRSE